MYEILKTETNACPNIPRACYWLGMVMAGHPGLLLLFIDPQRYGWLKIEYAS